MKEFTAGSIDILSRPHVLSSRDSKYTRIEPFQGELTAAKALDLIDWPVKFRKEYTAFIVDGVEILPAEYDTFVLNSHQRIRVSLMARGGGGSKQILSLVATIGLAVLLPGVGAFFGAGLVGALGQIGFGLVGSLLIGAIFKPKAPSTKSVSNEASPSNYVLNNQGNQASPYATIPRQYGRLKIAPVVAALPFNSSTGDDNFTTIVYSFGYGPMEITDLKVGDTPFDQIAGASSVFHPAYKVGDPPLQYYAYDIDQQSQNIALKKDAYTTLTSSLDTSQMDVEITFPSGVYAIAPNSDRYPWAVDFVMQYRNISESTWHDLFDGGVRVLLPTVGLPGGEGGATAGFRPIGGLFTRTYTTNTHLNFPYPSQWQLRIARVTVDDENFPNPQRDGVRITQSVLTAVRSFRTGYPAVSPKKAQALLEVQIRANEQVNGAIQEITAISTSVLRYWTGTEFLTKPTRNPAWAFADVLTGNANPRPVADDRIDWDNIKEWADFCDFVMPDGQARYQFDYQFNGETTTFEAINTITSAGRASFTLRDGLFGVIIDTEQTVPVQVFTPLNSSGLQGSKKYLEAPHGLRIKFISPERDWIQDEIIVYNDGYNVMNASLFEELSLPGVTNSNQAWRDGRYYLAQGQLRLEQVTLTTDIENLVCRRNDLVLVQSDTMKVGGDARRVINYNSTTRFVTLDAPYFLPGTTSYGARIRTRDGGISPVIGINLIDEYTMQLAPNSLTINPDDLIIYGESTQVTGEYLVKEVKANQDLSATLTLIEVGRGIYTADTGDIPPYNPQGGSLTVGYGNPVQNLAYQLNSYYDGRYPFADLTLTWTPPSGLPPRKYRIERVEESGSVVYIGETFNTSFSPVIHADIIRGGLAGVTQIYRVTPVWSVVVGQSTDIAVTYPDDLEIYPPSAVTNGTYSIEKFGIRFTWGEIDDPQVSDYELRVGADWDSAVPLSGQVTRIRGSNYLWNVVTAGTYNILIKSFDSETQQFSEEAYAINAVIAAPVATSANYIISGPNYALLWDQVPGTFATDRYRIYKGTFDTAGIIAEPFSTRFEAKADWNNNKNFWITVIDVAGNESLPVELSIQIIAPTAVSGFTGSTIDNNALLQWSKPAATLPIDRYFIRKGDVFATAIPLGSAAGDLTFSSIFETAAGLYTYWIYAVDSAGNSGPPTSLSLQLSPPPDFQLQADYYPDLTDPLETTLSNFEIIDGVVTGPLVNETWEEHFVNNMFSTPADQVAAGFPRYYQPSATSGYVESILDYGVNVDSSSVAVTASFNVLYGSPTITPTISVRSDPADPWVDYPASAQLFATDFRYVKARFTVNAPVGNELVEFYSINIKLALKKQTDSGSGMAMASDPTGTPVYFNKNFIDIDNISVTAIGLLPRQYAVNFVDSPYPTMFRVLFFDPVTGNRVDQSYTWSATGV